MLPGCPHFSSALHCLVVVLLVRGASTHGNHHHHHHNNDQNRILPVEENGSRSSGTRCGTSISTTNMILAERAYQSWLEQHTCTSCFLQSIARETVQVRTVWHNVERTDGSEGVSQDDIQANIDALNDAFRGQGFEFVLGATTTSRNDAWWEATQDSNRDSAEVDMKMNLRDGDCSDLNIYSKSAGAEDLGWATFPWDCEGDTTYDGVVIDYQTVPGGAIPQYNEGITLVHQVGHWLGLFHPFEGGCTEPNDFVRDTPPDAEPDFDCNIGIDSCGNGSPDNVQNYMNFGPDFCLVEFTFEQLGRMHAQHAAFRFPTGTNTPAPGPDTSSTEGAPTDPTPAPTEASSPACFSEVATVPVQNVGPTEMSKLQRGDKILTSRGYQPIYAFAHDNRTNSAHFLQIHTEDQVLEISEEHLVYVVGKSHPRRAASIRPGDVMIDEAYGAVVQKVNKVERKGLYAPLTSSGTILVDGILSSCYTSLQQRASEYMELQGGIRTPLSHHFLIHMWLVPFRMVCIGVSSDFCNSFDSETGLAHFVQAGFRFADFLDRQHICWQIPLLMLYLLVLGPLWVLEWAVGPEMAIYALPLFSFLALILRIWRIHLGLSIETLRKKKID